ncbi:MAG: DNA polymerase IV, partial [Oscillospiraceae bacterium]
VPQNLSSYHEYSKLVKNIYLQYTDLVEPFGIDECWLDVTGSTFLFGCGEKIAYEIKERVKKETNLTISVGVSFNKTFAKLGSDLKKPDAVTIISKKNFKKIIYPLGVD